MVDAIPQDFKRPEVPEHEYIVLSPRCVWGEVGEVIRLALTENQELSLVEAGTLKRAPMRPVVVEKKEGKDNG